MGENVDLNWIIRETRSADAPEISRLSTQLGYPCELEETLKYLVDIKADPVHEVLVAEHSPDGLAGYVHIFLTKRIFMAAFAELGGLVVDEKFRGSGIGGSLLEKSEQWAEGQGCKEMRVRSNLLREKARGFYLSRGYRDSKHQAVYLKVLSG